MARHWTRPLCVEGAGAHSLLPFALKAAQDMVSSLTVRGNIRGRAAVAVRCLGSFYVQI